MHAQVKFAETGGWTNTVPPTAGHIREAETPDGIVLFDPRFGKQFPLDPVATCIWKSVKARQTIAEIVENLSTTCGVPREQVLEDVLEFVEDLKKEHLLEELLGPPPPSRINRVKLWAIWILNWLGSGEATKE